jgi:LPS O-antigen subunit length determinant protein (WzzB/FepE family)
MNEIDDNKVNVHTQQEEQEIDLIELVQKIWAERKLILKICSYALLIGLVVAFSIPKEYTTKVTLAPEVSEKSGIEGVGALVAMAGVSLANKSNEDALSVELYPDIVSSTPFLTNLFNIKVSDKKGKIETTLYTYLKEKQHFAWWGYIFSFPFEALGWFRSLFINDESETGNRELNPFMLTKDEATIVKKLDKCILISNDKKTKITKLSVTMQDPLISANVTNIVLKNLQDYITDYRTNKARLNLEFTEKLYKEAKGDYDIAQQKYAQYTDKNQNTILQMARIEGERLVNEKNLTFDIYTQIAQQLQMAKVKVQEITPVYTVVEPATVSLQPSKPNKILILIGFVFVGGVGGIGWIVFMKDFMRSWKEKQMEKSLNL